MKNRIAKFGSQVSSSENFRHLFNNSINVRVKGSDWGGGCRNIRQTAETETVEGQLAASSTGESFQWTSVVGEHETAQQSVLRGGH